MTDTVMADADTLFMTTEYVNPEGALTSTGRAYTVDQKVESILDAAWGQDRWNPTLLGYGVQKRKDYRRYPPARLWWSVRKDKAWNDPTMQELFTDVPLQENECTIS
jgi:hypothetical protein